MLQITLPALELWDEKREKFINAKEQVLQLEHSLVSLRKWESKWHKPFLSKEDKTDEETLDYIKCMTITQNVNPDVYDRLTSDHFQQIHDYINNPMTATTFSENKHEKASREIITAELIYYWMIALTIPPQYEKWHLNSLLTLIKVCNIKNAPPKKQSKRDIMSRNAALNAARRKQLNTKG
jgi:hypothetical protein